MKTVLVVTLLFGVLAGPALAQNVVLPGVPDINQPPFIMGMPFPYPNPWTTPAISGTIHSWCTPTAAANVVWY